MSLVHDYDVESSDSVSEADMYCMDLHAGVFPLKLRFMCVRSEAQRCWAF